MSFSVTLPDGSKKDFDKAVSVKELASSIATSLGKAAVGAKINGVMKPLDYIVDEVKARRLMERVRFLSKEVFVGGKNRRN